MRVSGNERREKIMELLKSAEAPLSGSTLAGMLGVSRQVIVTDIALLRKEYPDLLATNSGYLLMRSDARRRIYKVCHDDGQTEEELNGIVDLGGVVLDVFIEHRIYGTMRAPLSISTRRDVKNFLKDMESGVSSPLKNITHGYHYHTVEAKSEDILDEIGDMLQEKGFLISVQSDSVVYSPKSYDTV